MAHVASYFGHETEQDASSYDEVMLRQWAQGASGEMYDWTEDAIKRCDELIAKVDAAEPR